MLTDLGGCVSGAVDTFLQSVVTDALNPLLGMLSDTLLTTPTPDQLPQLRELWERSWQIVLTVYSLFILLAGILLMGYESVQTRYSVREIAPRLLFGFLAGALSLTVAGFAVDTANALATALLDGGVDPRSGAVGLRQLLTSAVTTDNGALFLLLLGFAIVVALVVVLLGYVVRVLLTVILIAGAPIALMFHALPQTEGIARWWWRTFGACLAIQVVQSLTLVTALNLLLTPGRGFSVFTEPGQGADRDQALPTMLVVLALLFILCRIPFWLLAGSRVGQGRSLIGSIVRGFVAYRVLGLLRGQANRRPPGGGNPPPAGSTGSAGGGPRRWSRRRRSRRRRPGGGGPGRRSRQAVPEAVAAARAGAVPAVPVVGSRWCGWPRSRRAAGGGSRGGSRGGGRGTGPGRGRPATPDGPGSSGGGPGAGAGHGGRGGGRRLDPTWSHRSAGALGPPGSGPRPARERSGAPRSASAAPAPHPDRTHRWASARAHGDRGVAAAGRSVPAPGRVRHTPRPHDRSSNVTPAYADYSTPAPPRAAAPATPRAPSAPAAPRQQQPDRSAPRVRSTDRGAAPPTRPRSRHRHLAPSPAPAMSPATRRRRRGSDSSGDDPS